jgi:polyhydroxybutyrate depolymerase
VRVFVVVCAVCAVVVGAVACAGEAARIPDKDGDEALDGAVHARFAVVDPDHQDWRDRSFVLHLPPGYDGGALPVVVDFHGGGGDADGAFVLTCDGGGTFNNASCLAAKADEEGFAVVAPEGTPAHFFPNHRTWNAGGRKDDDVFRCVSGRACDENVDDMAFFDALLDEVHRGVAVDDARVFVTGMSNGAAMAHRVGCERSTVVAAVGAVAGGNQLEAVQGCHPARPVPVLQISGTDDPCWRFGADDEMGACEARVNATKIHVSIEETLEGWRARNGCGEEFSEAAVDDDADDGLSAVHRAFAGCIDDAAVEAIVVEGGGHAWPGGYTYLGDDVIGKTTADFRANDALWDFFEQHPLP